MSHTHTQATKCDGDGDDDAAANKRARRNSGGGGTAKYKKNAHKKEQKNDNEMLDNDYFAMSFRHFLFVRCTFKLFFYIPKKANKKKCRSTITKNNAHTHSHISSRITVERRDDSR